RKRFIAGSMDFSGALNIVLVLVASCLLFLLACRKKKFKNLPPGPTPLPFIGNMHQVDVKELIKSLRELSGTYGPMYTFHLGSRPCVVLSGYKVLKEALIDKAEEFSGRGDFPAVQMWSNGNGIVYGTGERWRSLRRFAISTLKNFGMGKRSLEERIKEEAQFLMAEFRKTQGKPFDPTFFLSCAGSNIICTLVFGDRFEYTDKKFLTLLDLINSNWKLMSSTWGQVSWGRWLGCLDSGLPPTLASALLERIEMNRETLDSNHMRDFIDCFLIKLQQVRAASTMSKTTVNLFFAGTETVSSTLRYGLRILLRHPEVEEKLHEEIDRVIGPNRSPCMEDRSRMPYTDAVLHEIQRYADIVPMGVPHTVTRDIEFRGYTLPKVPATAQAGALTLVLTFDPTQFKNPNSFDPTHFLDENGRFRKNDALMAFSAGKRVCLGESLAIMELFIFLTSILQSFNLKPLMDPKDIDITPESSGLGNIPRPYQFCLLPR
uniref:Cytochrome P450 family 2 subfamily AH member 13 n=1 Tax=Sphenodon punctatus TaxID=8508 RepID=A0A8D0HS06_SPHPU